jgi:hypothetical protein
MKWSTVLWWLYWRWEALENAPACCYYALFGKILFVLLDNLQSFLYRQRDEWELLRRSIRLIAMRQPQLIRLHQSPLCSVKAAPMEPDS